MSKAREARLEAVVLDIKRQLLLTLGQQQRIVANAVQRRLRDEAAHVEALLQRQLEHIDWALASDTAAIEVTPQLETQH